MADSQMRYHSDVGGIADTTTRQHTKVLHVFELKKFENGGNKWVSKRTETHPNNITSLMEVDEFLDQVDNIFDRRSFGCLKLVLLRMTVIAIAIVIGIGAVFVAVTVTGGFIQYLVFASWIPLGCCAWYYVEEKKNRQKKDLSQLVSTWNNEENGQLNAGMCLKLDDFFWEGIYPPSGRQGIAGGAPPAKQLQSSSKQQQQSPWKRFRSCVQTRAVPKQKNQGSRRKPAVSSQQRPLVDGAVVAAMVVIAVYEEAVVVTVSSSCSSRVTCW